MIIRKLEVIQENIEDLIEDIKSGLLTEYDDTINYKNPPKMYDKCPHCEYVSYDCVKEVLEDAIMKVKCHRCGNTYYTFWGK